MKLTPTCLQFIKDHEGFRGEAYMDSVGVWTIGYGSARTFRGQPIYPGMRCTEAEASEALEEDIPKYQGFLTFFKRSFNNNQVGALTSFSYNVGNGVFVNDSWDPNANDDDIVASLNNYHRPPEIIGRRNDEVELYLTPDSGEIPAPEYPPNQDPDPPRQGDSSLTDKMKRLTDAVLEFVTKAINVDVYNYSHHNIWASTYIKIERTYNNRLHTSLNPNFIEELKEKLTLQNTGQDTPDVPPPPPPEPGKPGSPPPDDGLLAAMYQWVKDREGQSLDFDGFPPEQPFQCVDMITVMNQALNLGLKLDGAFASGIWQNAIPDSWHRIEGAPDNDVRAAEIWNNDVPTGAIVWFIGGIGGAGHVAMKSGDAFWMLGQNQPLPRVTNTNLALGAPNNLGFVQAWVPNG